ncbi:MAG: hypothetical protein AAFN80_13180 [Pseudomonadota bacterium]
MQAIQRCFWNGFIFLICIFIAYETAHADVLKFFPSKPIHEDDSLTGEYDLSVEDCRFHIIKFSPDRENPQFINHTKVDLSDFITIPFLVGGGGTRYSSRVTVAWFVESHVREEIKELQSELRETRIPLFCQRKNLPASELSERRLKLNSMLSQIRDGESGDFVQRNHAFTYEVGEPPKLNSVSLAYAFQLPSNGWESGQLIQAIFEHQLDRCPDIILSILDQLDGTTGGQIDPSFLEHLKLELDPATKSVKRKN